MSENEADIRGATEDVYVVFPDARFYHRPNCLLVRAKNYSGTTMLAIPLGLGPCPLCARHCRMRTSGTRRPAQDVFGSHVLWLLADNPEEDTQIMGIGPNCARSGTPRGELQELIDQLVANPVLAHTVCANTTLKRRTPHHRTPPCRTSIRRRLPGCSVQVADHPSKCRTGRMQHSRASKPRDRSGIPCGNVLTDQHWGWASPVVVPVADT
jgi:hypothetical protein